MKMSDEQKLFAAVDRLLRRYYELGERQLDVYRKLHPHPVPQKIINGALFAAVDGVYYPIAEAARRASYDTDAALVSIVETTWNYFYLNMKGIRSAVRQGVDRTVMESCYQKLIPYLGMSAAAQKQLIVKLLLCDRGMVISAPSPKDKQNLPDYIEDYKYLVAELDNPKEQTKYLGLLKGDNTHLFAKYKHELWPSFFKAYTDNDSKLVFPWADQNEERAKSGLRRMYLHQHDYVHGNNLSALTAIDSVKTRRHMFNSFAIMTQTGYQVLDVVNKEMLQGNEVKIDSLLKRTEKLGLRLLERSMRLDAIQPR